jgi:hypothetical protein
VGSSPLSIIEELIVATKQIPLSSMRKNYCSRTTLHLAKTCFNYHGPLKMDLRKQKNPEMKFKLTFCHLILVHDQEDLSDEHVIHL